MNWTQVSVDVDGEAAEAVAEALRPFAYGGVSLEQVVDDTAPPGEVDLSSGVIIPELVQALGRDRRRVAETAAALLSRASSEAVAPLLHQEEALCRLLVRRANLYRKRIMPY